jgi:hypothetical protein
MVFIRTRFGLPPTNKMGSHNYEPLYGNSFLTNREGVKWGEVKNSIFKRWSLKGLMKVKQHLNKYFSKWRPQKKLTR